MDDLIKRLEAATGPSRELDARIWCTINDKPLYEYDTPEYGWLTAYKSGWIKIDGCPKQSLQYTSSIDAALTLVPDELDWLVRSPTMASVKYKSKCFANVIRECAEDIKHNEGWHETAAIALCIAALKARL